jgi:N-acyl-D-aspartate/D-glutamate deacylase
MYDLVIRGGTIVDGSGGKKFAGDVAIENGLITQVGGKGGLAKRVIEAEGLLVTPGWVDVHTHYDGQAIWDPVLAPSSWHGVTTALFGNCGVGLAPVRPQDRDCLLGLMEGVEGIPRATLREGIRWDWESFPQFLDALEKIPRAIDVGAQVPHHPLRVYVMGERAVRNEKATAEDVAAMRALTAEALQAGAFGFTTSRTDLHRTTHGEHVPGRYAAPDELLGIGTALGDVDRGAFGMLSDFEDEAGEFDWMAQLSHTTGRPLWFPLRDQTSDPQRWRRLMQKTRVARAAGASISALVAGRPVGLLLGLTTALNPFIAKPSFAALSHLEHAERIVQLREPKLRQTILDELNSVELLAAVPPNQRSMVSRWERMYVLGDRPNYEPEAADSIASMAQRAKRSPQAFCYDYLVGEDGKRMLYFPVTDYEHGDHQVLHSMLSEPVTLLGLGESGAHCGLICDSSVPSFMLTHWVRDRTRGPTLPLELVVKRQTSEAADLFGLTDRGQLKPGLRADINVINFNTMRLFAPELVHDLPATGKRLVQRVHGYTATIVAGEPIFEDGVETGARPGKLVRAGRP